MSVEIRVLGPFEVRAGERVLDLGGPRLRTALALLVAEAGRTVAVAALTDALWGDEPPAGAGRTVRTYLSRLRRVLAPAGPGVELVTRAPGYLLRVGPEVLDTARFDGAVAAGRAALTGGRPAEASQVLAGALGLWRGAAYGEFAGTAALAIEGARWERRRLAVLLDRIDADLAAGAGAELVAELEALVARHPEDERLCGRLLTALYRADRQADALAAYRRARSVLVERFGVEPSPALAEVHRQVLSHDPALLPFPAPAPVPAAAPVPAPAPAPAAVPVAQLPAGVRDFTGRAAELAALDALAGDSGGMPIVVLSGTAGVGKTGLAVHWGHRVAARFPDGQLYVNLRGFDPGGAPVAPAEVLRGFLHALAVLPHRVPDGLDDRAALLRSQLAGRRVLMVLDNARDAGQVRPLLPGAAGCLVLVTSRDALTGLVVRDGARRLPLDVLIEPEALNLLQALTGRAADEAAAALVRQCARLPLAIRIAADLAVRAGDLSGLVADLADEQHRLDLLDTGDDDSTAVRAVFSWSERQLPEPAARLFRLLGTHPGRDVDATAAAALAGTDAPAARRLLSTLDRASLLVRVGPDRWTLHDLLRAFARERSAAELPAADRAAAVTALAESYMDRLPAAVAAATGRRTGPAMDAGVARIWLDAERANLVAVALSRTDAVAVRLARELRHYLTVGFHNAEALVLHGHAADVAPAAVDRAYALVALGATHARCGRSEEALGRYGTALALFREAGDLDGEARTLHERASCEARLGRWPAALASYRAALDGHRATGSRAAEAAALASIGQLRWKRGELDAAVADLEAAATIYGEVGHGVGQGRILNDLGTSLQRRGRYAEARDRHERALSILDRVGDRAAAACALTDLGRIDSLTGRHADALALHDRALAVFREIGDVIGEAEVLVDRGEAQRRSGRPAEAAETHQQAHALAVGLDDRRLQSLALVGRGRSLGATGRPAEALALHRVARAHAAELGDRETEAQALDGMGEAYAATGRAEDARRCWTEALAAYEALGLPEADGIRERLASRTAVTA